ncbi:MAG: tRNA dihydrouridine synthase DusB [Spirochaetes bacterium]|nr:tRNA dihydrouridine synthase DusB [Spirochaetota bacterium]
MENFEEKRISLGRLRIASPLVLAPMAGYTDSPFRRIARTHGAGFTVTELISAEGIVRGNAKTKKLLIFTESERPIGIQIFGNDVNVMETAAQIVETFLPDFIDINMGCCAPKVCNVGMGAALLKDVTLLGKIAKKVVRAVHVPVSAKIRLGWDFTNLNYREVIHALEDSGVDFITVHGRTRSQMFSGKSDWNAISQIASFSKVPIIGNGDIASYAEAIARLKESNCAAVMIGRGAIGNPWIFSGKLPTFEERIKQIIHHIDLMISMYGEYGIILMRKHLVKYIHGFRGAALFRNQLLHAKERNEVIFLLQQMQDEYIKYNVTA